MIKIKDNSSELLKKLQRKISKVEASIHQSLEEEVKEVVVDSVTDNSNWNPDAVYKNPSSPQFGEPYDLEETGQIMSVIKNPLFNTVSGSNGRYVLGVGNVRELDSLVSPKKGSNPDNRYWRLVVYGRAAIKGWKFIPTGAKGRKQTGFAVQRADSEIAESEPTHMFENGLADAKGEFPKIISDAVKRGMK